MAELNLRDKVIEARVAWVGLDLETVSGHFGSRAQVAESPADRVVVDVGPLHSELLRDCSLRLRLVAERSGLSAEGTRDLLEAADGVVIVEDAGANDQGSSAVELVRGLLAERRTPVIVRALGHGVDETLKQVVDAVIESMSQANGKVGASNDTSPADRSDERNPLFNALRRVLERTAEAQAQKLADDVSERFERSLDERLRGLVERVEAVERAQTAAGLFEHHQSRASEELLEAARHSCTREDLAASVADLRTELAKIAEVSDGAAREIVTASSAVRRSVDAIGSEVRRTAAKDAVHDLTKKVGELKDESSAQLSRLAAAVPELPARISNVEAAGKLVARETGRVTEHVAAIDARLQEVVRGLEVDHPRLERIEVLVNELVEETRKSKKGWFG